MNALVASTSYALCPASGTRASQQQFVAVTKPCRQPCGPAWRLPVLVAAQSSAPQPYGNGPGSFASQEQLYRQTAVQSVWTSRLGAALGLAAELLRKAASFVYSCKDVLPNFTVLSPQQALRRMILILAASLLMVVLLTTIDSGLLYAYVRTARRVLC